MYIEQSLVRERQQERLRQAREDQAAQRVLGLRRLERRQERAERDLLRAWQRVERAWSMRGAAS